MSDKRTVLDQYTAKCSDLGCHFVATSDLPNGTNTGDEVDCPACADTEKQVKAARREALEEAYELMNDFFGKPATDLLDKLPEASP